MSDVDAVRDWWAEHPMTYGSEHGSTAYADGRHRLGDRALFERLDAEFCSWNRPLHGRDPFDRLFPYGDFGPGSRVLEIGCGLGTMAMAWAKRGVDLTAVDLNPVSVAQTRRRFELFGLPGRIETMDARALELPDASFDYVYSWGVLHHSPALARSIAELFRVLRPGGRYGIMLYHRHSLLYGYLTRYLEGFLHDESRFLDPLGLASRYGDGARAEGNPHTWPVTRAEFRALLAPYSDDTTIRTLGTDLDSVLVFLLPGLGPLLPAWARKPWARRFGWSLWAEGTRA